MIVGSKHSHAWFRMNEPLKSSTSTMYLALARARLQAHSRHRKDMGATLSPECTEKVAQHHFETNVKYVAIQL